jgi:hypothetical protein
MRLLEIHRLTGGVVINVPDHDLATRLPPTQPMRRVSNRRTVAEAGSPAESRP